jgi:hypothetical protein
MEISEFHLILFDLMPGPNLKKYNKIKKAIRNRHTG